MPRVSILLTCYNHIRYLPECLEGVFSQTFKDFEVIALDDGSTDGTREYLKARPEPVRCIFNEKNLGTYGTLNVGLENATGEFVAVLNDDDVWAPTKLEKQLAALEANPMAGLSHTGGWFIDGESKRIDDPRPLGFVYPRTESGDVLAALIQFNKIIASSALLKKECFERCGGFEPSFYGCGDWHMWLKVARKYHVAHVDEPLTFYRIHGKNACLDTDRMDEDAVRIRKWITTWQSEEAHRFAADPALKRMFAHNWACLGTELVYLGDGKAGRRAYWESLKLVPLRAKSLLRIGASFLPRKTFKALR